MSVFVVAGGEGRASFGEACELVGGEVGDASSNGDSCGMVGVEVGEVVADEAGEGFGESSGAGSERAGELGVVDLDRRVVIDW